MLLNAGHTSIPTLRASTSKRIVRYHIFNHLKNILRMWCNYSDLWSFNCLPYFTKRYRTWLLIFSVISTPLAYPLIHMSHHASPYQVMHRSNKKIGVLTFWGLRWVWSFFSNSFRLLEQQSFNIFISFSAYTILRRLSYHSLPYLCSGMQMGVRGMRRPRASSRGASNNGVFWKNA